MKRYEDFNLDLFNNEKYEINNRINNMWIIANDPIKYLKNRKKGRKSIEKKNKWEFKEINVIIWKKY